MYVYACIYIYRYVAVAWDSGRVDPVVFVGGRPAGSSPQTHPQTHPQTPPTNTGGGAGASATLPFHLELVRDPCDGVFPPNGVAGKGMAGGTLGVAAVASRLHRDVISPARDRDVNTVARVLMQSVIGPGRDQ